MKISEIIKYKEGQEFLDQDEYKFNGIPKEGVKEYAKGYKRIWVEEKEGRDIVVYTTLTTEFVPVKEFELDIYMENDYHLIIRKRIDNKLDSYIKINPESEDFFEDLIKYKHDFFKRRRRP